jgi:hypothetical protein
MKIIPVVVAVPKKAIFVFSRVSSPVHSPEDDKEDGDHGPDLFRARQHFAGRGLLRLGRIFRLHADVDRDRDDVADRSDDPRNERGGEQLGDVLLREDRIDDERDRRRDEDAKRAAGGERSRGEPTRIVIAPHLRQRNLRDRRGRSDRRSRHRAERRAREHGGHRHAAPEVTDQCVREAEECPGEATLGRELPHEQEQRDDGQVVNRKPRPRRSLQVIQERGVVREGDIPDRPGDEHGDRDRHAQGHQREHRDEQREADHRGRHTRFQS